MRHVHGLLAVSLFACACAAPALGCVFTLDLEHEDCALYFHAGCVAGSGSGTDGGIPAGCIPHNNAEPVDDTCGVFVSSSKGQDDNVGTKSAPLKTLQQAIDQAKGRPVYACAEEFAGSVTLAKGSAIYGGLGCSEGWAYVGATTKSALMGEPGKVALAITKEAGGAEVIDFTIQAVNAVAAGGSSIAVVAEQVTASLSRCALVAGDGAPGADGEDASNMQAKAGASGKNGGDACSANTVNGGAQVENDCEMESSIGGRGGDGNKSNGSDGSSGAPLASGKGAGGKGETFVGWDCSADGSNGGAGAGAAGQAGIAGAGAAMIDLGALSSSGFTGAAGGDGQLGKIGQGGGGGGGAKGDSTVMGMLCGSANPVGGASGGSGGAGGCGGVGGKGGQGGGASLALVSLTASLTLSEVTLKIGSGGKGGAGGKSQAGGAGGLGGGGGSNLSISGLKAGCDGGKGGPGGDGGAGGGGRGGHAIGLAYTGTAPTIGMERITSGAAGKGGLGGNGNLSGNQGADGVAMPTQEFR